MRYLTYLTYLIFFGLTIFVVLFATPLGLGLSPDSVSYLKGASGLLSGRGLDYVSAQWPPLYPVLVALFGAPSGEVMFGARILSAIFFAVNFVMIAELVSRVTHAKLWLIIILAGAICIQAPMTYVHFYAWSEPCLLACILVSLLLLSELNTKHNQTLIRTLLIIVACFAFLTRFAGVIVAVTNCVMIFLTTIERNFWSRLRRALIQFLIPVLVFLPWTTHRGISDGPATARIIDFHPISLTTINNGLMTIGRWMNPWSTPAYSQPINSFQLLSGISLLIVIALVVGWVLLKLVSKQRSGSETVSEVLQNRGMMLVVSCAVLTLTYIAFLIAALSFVDNKVELDNRILVLIYPPMMLCVIGLIYKIRVNALRNTILIVLVLLMSLALPNLKGWLLLSRYNGIEMSSRSITGSALQVLIKSCQMDLQAYADNPWNFDLSFNKKVLWLPSKILYNSGRINAAYEKELEEVQSKAQLIIIENNNADLISKIDQSDQFVRIRDMADGIVWLSKKNQTACVK